MDATDKREAILRAAAEMFGRKGFHDTKVEEIAEAAGVSKGTVYLYFKDKLFLLFEVHHFFMNQYLQTLEVAILPQQTGRGKLEAFLQLQFSLIPEMIHFRRMNFEYVLKAKEFTNLADQFSQYQDRVFGLLDSIIQYGQQSGEFGEVDVRKASLLVFGSSQAYFATSMLKEDFQIDAELIAKEVVELILNGIARSEQDRRE